MAGAPQGYIGRNPSDGRTAINRQTFNVTTGVQTSFTFTTGYDLGYLEVYLNGIKQNETTDYTAADGSTFSFAVSTPTVQGDTVEAIAYKSFNTTNVTGSTRDFSVGRNLDVSGNVTIGSSLTIASDLVVNGSYTYVNTEILDIEDKTVGIASTSAASNTTADGAGIIVYGGSDGDKSLLWNKDKANWVLVGGGVSIGTGCTIGSSTANVLEFSVDGAVNAKLNNYGAFIVGDGVAGEAWQNDYKTVQAGSGGFGGNAPAANAASYWTNNAYFDAVNSRWEYIAADEASRFEQGNGALAYYNAGAGSADGAITWSERLRINSSGNVIIGDSDTDNAGTGSDNLVIGANSGDNGLTIVSGSGNYNGTIRFSDGANSGSDYMRGTIQYYHGDNYMRFYTDAVERLRITAAGDVGIGTIAAVNTGAGATTGNTATLAVGIITCTSINAGDITAGNISGPTNGTTGSFTGNVTIGGNLDVDGQTDLDVLNVAETATFSSLIDANARLDVVGGANVDQVNVTGVSTFAGDVSIASAILHTGDTDTKITFTANQIDFTTGGTSRIYANNYALYVQSGLPLAFLATSGDSPHIKSGGTNAQDLLFTTGTSNPTRLAIDSSGRVLIGKSASKASDGENVALLQVEKTGISMIDIAANGTTSSSYAALNLIRSDGTAVNDHTAVDDGDTVGRVNFIGADGSDRFNTCAAILAVADADFTANNCPADLIFSTNAGAATASERLRIDSGGRVLIGTTTNTAPIGWSNRLQVAGTDAAAGVSIRRDQNGTGGALLVFGKSRGSLNGTTIVNDGDQIGGMYFAGADGTDVNSIAAQISVEVDGTPGSNDMPGRIMFKTTGDGSASPTERLRIFSDGDIQMGSISGIGNSAPAFSGTHTAFRIDGGQPVLYLRETDQSVGTQDSYLGRAGDILYMANQGGDIVWQTSADSVSTSERMRLNVAGRLLIGTTDDSSVWGFGQGSLQVKGNWQGASASFINNEDNTNNHAITLGKIRGTSIVNNGDVCGSVAWNGYDGSAFKPVCRITGEVDNVPGSGDMPGRMVFYTTPDGAATPVERARITYHGIMQFKGGESLFGDGVSVIEIGTGNNVSLADEASFTMTGLANVGAILSVGTQRDASNQIKYRQGLFFTNYGSATVTELSDENNNFATSDTDGYVCVYATSSANGNVVVKNRLGHTTVIAVSAIRCMGL